MADITQKGLANLIPWKKGQSGNPNINSRQEVIAEFRRIQRAARIRSMEALSVIIDIMRTSDEDAVRLKAADLVIERGFGLLIKAIEKGQCDNLLEGAHETPDRIESIKDVLGKFGLQVVPCSNSESSPDVIYETVDSSDESDAKESSPPAILDVTPPPVQKRARTRSSSMTASPPSTGGTRSRRSSTP